MAEGAAALLNESRTVGSVRSGTERNGTMHRTTGKQLARTAKLPVAHALYRLTGDWYHLLERFPGALFDAKGYILFDDERAYAEFLRDRHSLGIKQNTQTNILIVRKGIAAHPGYVATA